MTTIYNINRLPTSVEENTTNHLNHHSTIHAALKDHVTRIHNAEQASVHADGRATSAENKVDAYTPRVDALEAMNGVSPETPVDGQTANLVAQSGTLTSDAVIDSIQRRTVSVSVTDFGALGDGVADDTAAINSAISWVHEQGGGRVIVPAGEYMVWGHITDYTGSYLRQEVGVVMQDNVHLDMVGDAVLRCIPNSRGQYNIITVLGRKNVRITGGRVVGERYEHTGTTGEWGYGIAVFGGENVSISGTHISDCWGDGINLQYGIGHTVESPHVPENVHISSVICSGNRRQGMSVEGVNGLTVEDSIFTLTGGIAPNAGVDIEPVNNNNPVLNMVFRRCRFTKNQACGLLAMMNGIDGLTVEDCVFEDNGDSEAQLKTYSMNGRNISFVRNIFKGSTRDSIRVQGGSRVLVSDNYADTHIRAYSGPGSAGVRDLTVRSNTVQGIIYLSRVLSGSIQGNKITTPNAGDLASLSIVGCEDLEVSGNTIDGAIRNVWIFNGHSSANPPSSRILVKDNILRNAGASSIEIANVDTVDVRGNHMIGAGGASYESQNIYLASSATRLRILDNVFEHGDSGDFRTRDAIRLGYSDTDIVVYGNTLRPEDGFSYGLYRGSRPGTGYIGNERGIMVGTTGGRPTIPLVGTQYFDTTLSKMVIWSGAEWVNLDGTPLDP